MAHAVLSLSRKLPHPKNLTLIFAAFQVGKPTGISYIHIVYPTQRKGLIDTRTVTLLHSQPSVDTASFCTSFWSFFWWCCNEMQVVYQLVSSLKDTESNLEVLLDITKVFY